MKYRKALWEIASRTVLAVRKAKNLEATLETKLLNMG